MKQIVYILLLAAIGSGCYTQVKSTGDYWGYSGRYRRTVLVESDTIRPQEPQQTVVDTSAPPQQDYTDLPPDDGTTIINNYYEVEPWGHPYWWDWGYRHYYSPGVSFSISFGSPGWGYYDPYYYPYSYWYNDPWYWGPGYYRTSYYDVGFGCLVPPYYPHYFGHRHRYYLPDYGGNNHNNHAGNGYRGGSKRGRINDGESRSGRSINSGSGGRSFNRSTSTIPNTGGTTRSTTPRTQQWNTDQRSSSGSNRSSSTTTPQPVERRSSQPEQRSRPSSENSSSGGSMRTAPAPAPSQSRPENSSAPRSESPRQSSVSSGRSSGR